MKTAKQGAVIKTKEVRVGVNGYGVIVKDGQESIQMTHEAPGVKRNFIGQKGIHKP